MLFWMLACTEAEEPVSWPTPWRRAEPTGEQIAGEFDTVMGSELPGRGWFQTGDTAGNDLSRARRFASEDLSWDVVRVQILGNQDGEWHTLELDVSLDHWVAGEVALDGREAVGVLRRPGEADQYLLGGVLHLERAGIDRDEPVSGYFGGIDLAVAP